MDATLLEAPPTPVAPTPPSKRPIQNAPVPEGKRPVPLALGVKMDKTYDLISKHLDIIAENLAAMFRNRHTDGYKDLIRQTVDLIEKKVNDMVSKADIIAGGRRRKRSTRRVKKF